MTLTSLLAFAALAQSHSGGEVFPVVLGDEVGAAVGTERQLFHNAVRWWASPRSEWVIALTAGALDMRPGRVMPRDGKAGELWLAAAPVAGGEPWRIMRLHEENGEPAVIWSFDGKYAVVEVESHRSRTEEAQWGTELVLVDPRARRVKPLARFDSTPEGFTNIFAVPGAPVIVQKRVQHGEGLALSRVGVLTAAQTLVWIDFPQTELEPSEHEWAVDAKGRPVAFVPGTDLRYVFDAGAAKHFAVRGEVALYKPADRAPCLEFRLREHGISYQQASFQRTGLWLEADGAAPERELVTFGVHQHTVAEDWSWVAYSNGLSVCSRPIELLDAVLVRQMRDAAERTRLLSNAKQVGTAIALFLVDYDDQLPPKAGFEDKIMPYVRNADLLKGFVYLLDGQSAASFDWPSETEMGYIPFQGGRAVVYLDGHAKIIYDKPPA